MYVFVEKLKQKLSLNYHCHPLLSGALLRSCGTYANTYIEDILMENTHLNKNESKIEDITDTVRLPKIS